MEQKSFKAFVERYKDSLYENLIPIPEDLAQHFLSRKQTRVIAHYNSEITRHQAIMPVKGKFFLMVNQDMLKKLKLEIGDPISISLEPDNSKYGMPMPEELDETLIMEHPAKEIFEQLTPGKQRTLIHLVAKVKNPDSRIRKALAISEHLKESGGKLDFKRLNVLIKQYNNYK